MRARSAFAANPARVGARRGYQNLRQPFALTEGKLQYLGEALNIVAEVLLDFGLTPSSRNRLGTQLETAEELHILMEATEPELVSLTPDVGQAMVAGTRPKSWCGSTTRGSPCCSVRTLI